eukprot:3482849-Prorocentrum_lima.AAC.1
MTSSLVGSEMCIRDSGAAPATATASRTAAMRSGVFSCRRRLNMRTCARGCLLYTSDAADDM